jgi:hypothetical protein
MNVVYSTKLLIGKLNATELGKSGFKMSAAILPALLGSALSIGTESWPMICPPHRR